MKKKFTLVLFAVIICTLPLCGQVSKTINIASAGTLNTLLTSDELNTVTNLTLTGQIDQRDFVTMRDKMAALTNVDLKGVNILAYSNYAANEIPIDAFYTLYAESRFKSIILPETLTSIGELAFCYCQKITSIKLPATLTTIGNHAFTNCTGLTNIILPSALTTIGDEAFTGCNFNTFKIEAIIPPSIGRYTLNGIPIVYVPKGSRDSYKAANYWKDLFIIESEGSTQVGKSINVTTAGTLHTLLSQNELKTITDLTLTGQIDQRDFVTMRDSMPVLTNIDMKSIYVMAYSNFAANEIPEHAFNVLYNSSYFGKKSLTSIILPDAITAIKNSAFEDCSNLKNINLPAKLISIGDKAYYGCKVGSCIIEAKTPPIIQSESLGSIQTFYVPKGSGEIYRTADYWKIKTIVEDEGTALHLNIYTPGTLSAEIESAGYMANEINFLVLEGQLNASDLSFIKSNMQGLITIDLSETNVTSMPVSTFTDKRNLLSIILPKSLKAIEANTFKGCTGLKNIKLPETLNYIENSAFESCTNLTNINFPATVNYIGNNAFKDCSSLTDLELPDSLVSIGESTFSNCSSLKSVEVKKRLSSIGNNAFSYCISLANIEFPETLTKIGNEAFSNCINLANINFSVGLTHIGHFAFSGCYSLTSIELPEGLKSTGYASFYKCSNLRDVKLPKTLNYIDSGTFLYCSCLTNINIPEALISIQDNALSRTSITTINLPETLTSLSSEAFSYCTKLTKINFPSSLNGIGRYLFAGCSNLSEISTLRSSPIDLTAFLDHGAYIFSGVNKSTCKLIVPKGSVDAYKAAPVWKDFKNIIEFDATSINTASSAPTKAWTANGIIYISSEKLMNTVELFTLSGKALSKIYVGESTCQIDMNNEKMVIIKIIYLDGSSETIKVVNNQ